MVEYRRRLNNQLSQRKLEPESAFSLSSSSSSSTTTITGTNGNLTTTTKRTLLSGKKVRDPKCARCSAHGEEQALRGHKKATCPYLKCGCHLVCVIEIFNKKKLLKKLYSKNS